MIFRRSLVRELTATAIGLFLVLLAILFTNLVLRLLARAAGGAVAARGHPRACSASTPCSISTSCCRSRVFLTVLLTLSRWYRDSEMIVWFTSGPGADRVPEADPAVRRAVPGRDRRAFAVPVAVGRAAQDSNTSGSWSQRDEIDAASRPGCSRNSARANLVVFVESINPFDGTHPQRIPAFGRRRQGRDHGRPRRAISRRRPTATASSCWTNGRRYEGKPGTAGLPGRRVREARAPDRAGRVCAPFPRRPRPFRPQLLLIADGHVERAELFWRLSVPISALVLTLLAIPLSYVNPRIGRSFNLDLRGVPVHALQQLPQHRAELHRPGQLGFWAGLRRCRTRSPLGVVLLLFRHQLSIAGSARVGVRARSAPTAAA